MACPSHSELQLPIKRDTISFEERQKSIWEKMHDRMEQRRREWQDEMDQLRKDFFRLKPDNRMKLDYGPGTESVLEKGDHSVSGLISDSGENRKYFRVSFDVSQFKPDEISVKTQDQKLIVYAKHEEIGDSKSVSCEFSRHVDLPSSIDPAMLRSTLSSDGVLQVEADLPTVRMKPIHHGNVHIFDTSTTPTATTTTEVTTTSTTTEATTNAATTTTAADATTRAATTSATTATTAAGMIISDTADASEANDATDASRDISTTDIISPKQFLVTVDIGEEFQPEDLVVKTIDRKLIVHAKHVERISGRSSCREFNREFDLPDGVDPNHVTASFITDGRLVLEAPMNN